MIADYLKSISLILMQMKLGQQLTFAFVVNILLLCSYVLADAPPQTKTDYKLMTITLERSGGFTGIPQKKNLDVSALPESEASELNQLVDSSGFFNLPAIIPSTPLPDRFSYKITINREGNQHSVSVAETNVPEALKPLLDWLIAYKN